MSTNYTNARPTIEKLIYPELSYALTGLCFKVHNELGRYSRERQYGDALEEKLRQNNIPHIREQPIGATGNIVDFLIDDKIIVELKAKHLILKDDFLQVQRY